MMEGLQLVGGASSERGTAAPSTPDDASDAELVARHEQGIRQFAVYAYAVPEGVCLEVRADEGSQQACDPVAAGIDLRRIDIGDQDYLAGLVSGTITEVRMLANDGSPIAEEFDTAELVEVVGQSGYRAFAPLHPPGQYSGVVGYDADGDEVARVDIPPDA